MLIILTIGIALYVCFNHKKMHKFTKVAYFLLMFTLAAVTVGATQFAIGLFALCMFMIIIRVFTNRKEICDELGVHKEPAKNIPEVKEDVPGWTNVDTSTEEELKFDT